MKIAQITVPSRERLASRLPQLLAPTRRTLTPVTNPEETPLSTPFRKGREYVARVLVIVFFAVSIPLIIYQTIQHEIKVSELERAYAFARGTWCGGADSRVTFLPARDEVAVVFERGTQRIQGRAWALKVGNGVLLSITDQTASWDVQPVSANAISIWQTLPAEPGARRGAVNFERFVRCG